MMRNVAVEPLVLDTEALSLLARGRSDDTLALILAADKIGSPAVFPTIILSEILTGKPYDASVWRIVNQLTAVDLTVQIAAQAGRLRERAESVRRKKRDLTVDAIVAATAILWAPSLLITGDVDDLRLLTEGSDVKVISV